jgi:hypothetical protein
LRPTPMGWNQYCFWSPPPPSRDEQQLHVDIGALNLLNYIDSQRKDYPPFIPIKMSLSDMFSGLVSKL